MRSSACSKAGQGFENAGQLRRREPVFAQKIRCDEDQLKAERRAALTQLSGKNSEVGGRTRSSIRATWKRMNPALRLLRGENFEQPRNEETKSNR
jgi:hypothetical protein